jgi:hypothetical protein
MTQVHLEFNYSIFGAVFLVVFYSEYVFSYRVAAYSYRTVAKHAVVVRMLTLVSSSALIVKCSIKCKLREDDRMRQFYILLIFCFAHLKIS